MSHRQNPSTATYGRARYGTGRKPATTLTGRRAHRGELRLVHHQPASLSRSARPRRPQSSNSHTREAGLSFGPRPQERREHAGAGWLRRAAASSVDCGRGSGAPSVRTPRPGSFPLRAAPARPHAHPAMERCAASGPSAASRPGRMKRQPAQEGAREGVDRSPSSSSASLQVRLRGAGPLDGQLGERSRLDRSAALAAAAEAASAPEGSGSTPASARPAGEQGRATAPAPGERAARQPRHTPPPVQRRALPARRAGRIFGARLPE